MKNLDFDVSIVGSGPVGKTLAIELARRGWRVGIFEQHVANYPKPRAVVLDPETKRIIANVGDQERLEEIVEPVRDLYEWRNEKGDTLLSLPDWSKASFFSQPIMEQLLDDACKKYEGLDIYMGHKAVDVKQFDDYAELTVTDQSGQEKTITSQYIVGCDGANSFVRKHMDVELTDLGFSYDWLIVDMIMHEEREWAPMNWQLCDPNRPSTLVSGGPTRRRWEFMRLPNETIEEMNTEEKAWELVKPWDIIPENATLERHAVYTFRAKWAEDWRDGRLLLAGDAAHLMPPFYGQGMNSGVRDSKNLAWKLDYVLSGKTEESFLDTYTEERKPHAVDLIHSSIYLGKVICITDPEEAAKRDEAYLNGTAPAFPAFPSLEDGILQRKADGTTADLTGVVSVASKVSHQGKTGVLDDFTGTDWVVISIKEDPAKALNEKQLNFLKELGTSFVHLTEDDTSEHAFIDVEGNYLEYFNDNKIETLIVRPDFYNYGSTNIHSDLPKLVDELSQQIAIKEPTKA